jgi:hypothetical protein
VDGEIVTGGFKVQALRSFNVQGVLRKTLRSSFEGLRTNGGEVEIIGDFPFMLSSSKHS